MNSSQSAPTRSQQLVDLTMGEDRVERIDALLDEVERLREAIHAHRVRRNWETHMKPDRATFQLKRADEGLLDIGSVAIGCEVDFDTDRKCWRAWDEHGNEAWAEWKPLAAARLFVARMERDMEADDE